MKEKKIATEIVAVTVGPTAAQEQLRTALAMGADRAIHVVTDGDTLPLHVAKIFQKLCETEEPSIVILGKQVPHWLPCEGACTAVGWDAPPLPSAWPAALACMRSGALPPAHFVAHSPPNPDAAAGD